MSSVVKIDIKESVEELKTLLAAQTTAFGKERVQALYLLKTKQVETVQHLAAILGQSSHSESVGYAPIVVADYANYDPNTKVKGDRW